MSKVDELREKYPKITKVTFDRFVQGDETPTKKYLEYMLKTWTNRHLNGCIPVSASLVEIVKQFDSLLPYIEQKDIYSPIYSTVPKLKEVIKRAEEIKEEKTFVRESNIVVIEETEEYLLLRPITHRGSLKYGSQTKWCTASKNDINVYTRYVRDGLLLYLIDKQGDKGKNCPKVALYQRYNYDGITGEISVYNSLDHEVTSNDLSNGKWPEDVILKVTTLFRILFMKEKKIKKSKDFVEGFQHQLSILNFQALSEHMRLLDENTKIDYNTDIQEKINNFINSLNNVKNATSTTTTN